MDHLMKLVTTDLEWSYAIGEKDVNPKHLQAPAELLTLHRDVRLLVKVMGNFGTSLKEGANTSIYLASSPEVEGVTGHYFVKSLPRRSAAISYDESLQRHLWEQSAQLVNV